MSYVDIWNKIYDTIKDNQYLGSCYNYDIKQSEELPCAVILPFDTDVVAFDQTSDNFIYYFKIRVVNQDINSEIMEQNMRRLADSLLEDLKWIPEIISKRINWGYTDDEQPMRVFEITLWFRSLNC